MSYAELFYLDDAGEGRWTVRHQITGAPAGNLLRTSSGLTLFDDRTDEVGEFGTVEDTLRALYALA